MITKMLYIAISFIVGILIGVGLLKMFIELSKEKDNGTNS